MSTASLCWEGIEDARQAVERLAEAPPSTPVLLCGERGTGRQVLARYIHAKSARREQPFVAVNVGMSPRIVAVELFGSDPGIHLEAVAGGKGRFAQARHGTLFLDEIGQAPRAVQAKLFHALHTGRREVRPIDVRVIAADRELEAEVGSARFRKDLYNVLSTVSVRIAPLRDRGASAIRALATNYTEKLSREFNTRKRLTDEALDVFCQYTWPGNIRELQHSIQRAFLGSRTDEIDADHLALWNP